MEHFEKNIPCRYTCPIHSECSRYVQAIAESKDEEAYLLARTHNPFVAVLGRVCAHLCEYACRRRAIDDAISICALKRYAADQHAAHPTGHEKTSRPHREGAVAIVGAGPCGLTAAYDLALAGYRVEVFEATTVVGGMLCLGIPHHRLPREIISMEIDKILSQGITLHTRSAIGREITLRDLRTRFDAVFLAIGISRGRHLDIPGAKLDGVLQGIDFLIKDNMGDQVPVGKRVVVIGGGSVAMDAARTALRILLMPEEETTGIEDFRQAVDAARMAVRTGAHQVRILSRKPRRQMRASEYEIEGAEEEGVVLDDGWSPVEILGENGRVSGIAVRLSTSATEPLKDQLRIIPCETVILAVGQEADLAFLDKQDGIEVTEESTIKVDDRLATTAHGVFAGGDVVFGPRNLVDGVADGHRAAHSIHEHLSGHVRSEFQRRFRIMKEWTMPQGYLQIPRQAMPTLSRERRIAIAEVELGYGEAQARSEALRCLKCQVNTIFDGSKCILCGGCIDICPNHCFKLVDVARIEGDATYDALIEARYGVKPGELTPGLSAAIIKDETACIRCGLCARRCPAGAITMEAFETTACDIFE